MNIFGRVNLGDFVVVILGVILVLVKLSYFYLFFDC